MTPEMKQQVKISLEQVIPIADTAAMLFYNRLFELDPSLRALFRGDMQEQGRKLMAAIRMAVQSLDRMEALLPLIHQLGKRHAGYGVREEHYETVGAALLWTLERGLGTAFTPAIREAWTELYTLLAATMKEGAAEGSLLQTHRIPLPNHLQDGSPYRPDPAVSTC